MPTEKKTQKKSVKLRDLKAKKNPKGGGDIDIEKALTIGSASTGAGSGKIH